MGNLQAESGLIGAIVLNNDVLDEVVNIIRSDMFSNIMCKQSYEICLDAWESNRVVDATILTTKLENENINKEELIKFLHKCVDNAPQDRFTAKEYAKLVLDEYKSKCLKNIKDNFSLIPNNVDDDIAKISECLENIQKASTNNKPKTLSEIIAANKERYFKKHEINGCVTGFKKLDEIVTSLEAGSVTVIGARPSVGKSAFVTQMILQMAHIGKSIGYFNLEMTESQVYERMLAFTSRIDMQRIKKASCFDGNIEEEHFRRANEILEKFQISVNSGRISISQIRAIAKHEHYDAIVIDYLQLIQTDRQFANRSSEVGEISKAVKSLALELKIPIVLLSQLNRASEGKESKEPTMAELRESGDIEQDADNIFLIWNLSERFGKYKALKVEKNRQGERGKYIPLEFKGQMMCFVEREEPYEKFVSFVKEKDKNAFELTNYEDEDAEQIFKKKGEK